MEHEQSEINKLMENNNFLVSGVGPEVEPEFRSIREETVHQQELVGRSLPRTVRHRAKKRSPLPSGRGSDAYTRCMSAKSRHVLWTWFYEHETSPFPSGETKRKLAKTAGLSYKQVTTWFINARRRYRKRQPACLRNEPAIDPKQTTGIMSCKHDSNNNCVSQGDEVFQSKPTISRRPFTENSPASEIEYKGCNRESTSSRCTYNHGGATKQDVPPKTHCSGRVTKETRDTLRKKITNRMRMENEKRGAQSVYMTSESQQDSFERTSNCSQPWYHAAVQRLSTYIDKPIDLSVSGHETEMRRMKTFLENECYNSMSEAAEYQCPVFNFETYLRPISTGFYPREESINIYQKGTSTYLYKREPPTKVYPRDTSTDVYPRATSTEVYPRAISTEVYPRATSTEAYSRATSTEVYSRATRIETYPRETPIKMYPRETPIKIYPRETPIEIHPRETPIEINPRETPIEINPRGTSTGVDQRETFNEVYPKESSSELFQRNTPTEINSREEFTEILPGKTLRCFDSNLSVDYCSEIVTNETEWSHKNRPNQQECFNGLRGYGHNAIDLSIKTGCEETMSGQDVSSERWFRGGSYQHHEDICNPEIVAPIKESIQYCEHGDVGYNLQRVTDAALVRSSSRSTVDFQNSSCSQSYASWDTDQCANESTKQDTPSDSSSSLAMEEVPRSRSTICQTELQCQVERPRSNEQVAVEIGPGVRPGVAQLENNLGEDTAVEGLMCLQNAGDLPVDGASST